MRPEIIPPNILKILQSVEAKRPQTVIKHIMKHGYITTEELKEEYGYNHPPRAARDVREQGIPLETFRVKDSSGRLIAAYRFGKWEDFRVDKLRGRHAFPKKFKHELVARYGAKCHICQASFEERYLQIDHRIPYELAGDENCADRNPDDYMLLCSSCNRAKSWSCEHCENWAKTRDNSICAQCYWAFPESYTHIALREMRRLDIVWEGDEVYDYNQIKQASEDAGKELPKFVKDVLRRALLRKELDDARNPIQKGPNGGAT